MYSKVFARIAESSLMEEPISVRYTFLMLIAISDPEGYVIGTDVAIARRLNMSVAEFQECVNVLMSPDPNSNSKEEDGRRVVESGLERGYLIVNYLKYKNMKSETERREYMREYMKKYRSKPDVNSSKQRKRKLTHADAYASASEAGESPERGNNRRPGCESDVIEYVKSIGLQEEDGSWFWDKGVSSGWKNGGNPISCWKATARAWKRIKIFPTQKSSQQPELVRFRQ